MREGERGRRNGAWLGWLCSFGLVWFGRAKEDEGLMEGLIDSCCVFMDGWDGAVAYCVLRVVCVSRRVWVCDVYIHPWLDLRLSIALFIRAREAHLPVFLSCLLYSFRGCLLVGGVIFGDGLDWTGADWSGPSKVGRVTWGWMGKDDGRRGGRTGGGSYHGIWVLAWWLYLF